MKSLVLRIRKQYFDAIVNGAKTVEYRKASEFWRKRITGAENLEIAVFVCGKRVHRRKIVCIELLKTPDWFSEQGKQDVDTKECFAIHLGSVHRGNAEKGPNGTLGKQASFNSPKRESSPFSSFQPKRPRKAQAKKGEK